MHALVITSEDTTITFPTTKRIQHGGELEGAETVMSDGTLVFDVTGFRKNIKYSWDYIPQSVFDAFIPLLRKHKYFSCTYLDIDNTEKTAMFKIEYPTPEAWKLTANGAIWHNVSLNMTAKDVSEV